MQRIGLHSACEFAMETEGELPPCTPAEMWERPTVYAVKKKGGVRAKSLHDTQEEAEQALGKDCELEVRHGERIRCANFCAVSSYCDQWRAHKEDANKIEKEMI